ncbi:camp-dependent protein kinase 6 [Gilbertella persicaria]|uniref:camp-dependent protein kinase 6 n=1 Tax=Gilbertella persicaria TaxID=101096 RepID=UPI00221FAFCA|nr:camp-dependent protein kinase 6 [Gilbertella persicaria]KAI8069786.1 camp-dependent protein kinase 6 [Gilbertella persicaria]
MPTIINKLVDKAKPRFSFHHDGRKSKSGSTSSNESHHGKFHAITNALPTHNLATHIFGYKDDKNDNYVEPPPVPPTETQPIRENASVVSITTNSSNHTNPRPSEEHATKSGTNYTPFYPEQLPSTPPATPGGSFIQDNHSANSEDHANRNSTDQQITDSDVTRPRCHLKLQNFDIQRTLGTGSFGRVHLIRSKINNHYYALKVLKKAEIVKLKQVEHTNNERAILSSIQHPFIVNLWGSFQDSANLYMVMDFVPGGELFTVLRKQKKFSNEVARFYAGEVLLALSYLHSKDIVYRDLKPENLLLDMHGHIKITDFGFAKKVPDITWTLCGTPDYLAPEIIQTKGYGKAADYWAFGVLIFEMLAGHPPYYDENQFRLYEKILTTPPSYPSSIDSTAKDLLQHLLTTDLSQRFGNLKRGWLDIREHKWFSPLDFEKLLQRKIRPPHIPHLKGEGDASNFDKYPEEFYPYGVTQADPYKDRFPDF